jgi:hypothetical protein
MATFQSNTLTIVDQTDNRKFEVYIKSNMPTVQIFNQNIGACSPDWSSGLELAADVYLDSREMESYENVSFQWSVDDGSSVASVSKNRTYRTTTNMLESKPILTYICVATYQNVTATSKITFTRVDTGRNGTDGVDGTGVTILGSYDTLSTLQSTHPTGNPGDAYIIGTDLYVWDVDDAVWKNVGRIQGPAGKDGANAKSISLSGTSQVFKINKNNTAATPSIITINAIPLNTEITKWYYRLNNDSSWTEVSNNSPIAGVNRKDNRTIEINGMNLASTITSLTLRATDNTVEDVFTVYKAFDGTDGTPGNPGAPASMAFLTNENISFSANADGKVALTSFTTNVVAYNGSTKVTPTIGTITGLPSGMTVSDPVTTFNEQVLTFTISNNSTLGSELSNNGTITIPVTSPVSTNLILSWSKINTGATGVGISSTTVTYGVSGSSSVQPTKWQQTVPTVDDGEYLWTRTVIDYTDASREDTVTYTYAKQGTVGAQGNPGSSVTVSSIQYQEGSSATTAPTGTWSNAVVSVTDGMYLWTKTTFSDGNVAYGVAKQGSDGAIGIPGADAVTFQIYSSNGYALSTNTPMVTLQTFAYVGDVPITAGATYQWYAYNSTGWTELSNGSNAYLTISREDVSFSKSYMCKMTFNDVEYTSVATIDDKNDENKVFTSKPSNYSVGDLWIVGVDYMPAGIEAGTLLRAEHTNTTYEDDDWITATKYDEKINELKSNIDTYNQYFSFDSTDGLRISARDANGKASQFSTSLTNERLSFNYGNESIAYINGTKMNIKEAEIESPLTVTGKYSGSTMLQAPVINIGNFSIIVESNGSLSIVANT